MQAFFLACAVAAGASAQAPVAPKPADVPSDPAYAEAIAAAVEHYSAKRWTEAHAAFARAHALQPSARTQRGLGLAAFYLQRYAAAREAFERALADARRPLPAEQREELVALMRAAARESGRFELHVAPGSARVEVDGATSEQRVLFLERGDHQLSVHAPGHESERTVLHVIGGEDRTILLELAPLPAAAPERAQPASAPGAVVDTAASSAQARPPTASGGRVYTWVAAAAVPVFAGAAAAIWFSGEAKRDEIDGDCARASCDDAEVARRWDDAGLDAHETWTHVSLAAAGAALVTAVVLFAVEGAEPDGDTVALHATRAGAILSGQF